REQGGGTREAPGELIERQQRHELPELRTDPRRERDGGQPAEQGTEGDPPLPGMFRRGQGERPRQRRERERRERAHPEEVLPAEECAERRTRGSATGARRRAVYSAAALRSQASPSRYGWRTWKEAAARALAAGAPGTWRTMAAIASAASAGRSASAATQPPPTVPSRAL